ncbi:MULTISPECIES: glycosyltransferase family 2 protein [Chryseobacterium]|uniref:PGL/p-HBAD biosynthesis glycosyltransferase Rv2957/MT3031 n=1 Tax=Chryseobacterium taihuense TaxID=1141221 RepID=A0A4U8W9H5_9FLAO|nr:MULTISPECIES: glycosyltransferase family 2 protein [Chryseobacterium]QQV03728.1 glycosyltransferase [Chryseobacterium sp. FDAARGOS 1104]VFB02931.1 PGL/p-HBAD biosynthesis glycosyltransferase Rv2957/MT3031 [Chryseobacterium taihuense]
MKVSIITTCFNREKTIADAIKSVLNQDYKDIEYLVIDGASQDKSMEIIKKFQHQIDFLLSEKDTGIYNALNKGILNSKGEIVGLLHSDDLFYSHNTISQIVEVFKNTNADIVYANGMYIDNDSSNLVRRIYKAKDFKEQYLDFGWIPLHTTIFVKKSVFDSYGVYREDFKIASDYEISLRWFKNKKLKKIFHNRWVVKMRMGGKSTNIKMQKLKSAEDLQIIKEYHLKGYFTLICKVARKIPQYLLPKILDYK